MKKIILVISLILINTIISTDSSSNSSNNQNPIEPQCECAKDDLSCKVYKVGYNISSSSFKLNLKIGEQSKLILQQQECRSCGYKLDLVNDTVSNPSIIKYIGKKQAELKTSDANANDQPIVGGNNNICFEFKVLKAGKVLIPFNYYRPWDIENTSNKSAVEVEIIDDSTDKIHLTVNNLTQTELKKLDSYDVSIFGRPQSEGGYLKVVSKMFFILLILFFF